MPGFPDLDSVIAAETVSGFAQTRSFTKIATATTAAGIVKSTWTLAGIPPARPFSGAAATAAQVTSATTGALSFTNAGGSRELFLATIEAALQATSGTPTGTILVYDMLLYYPGISTAAAANALTNGVALPRYTSGAGVMAWLEVTGALGAGSGTVALAAYTDQDNNAGNAGAAVSLVVSTAAEHLPHRTLFLPLAAGDTGVRSVQTLTFTGTSTGTVALVLGRPLCAIPIPSAGVAGVADLVRGPRFGFPQLEDGAVLHFQILPGAAYTPTVSGSLLAIEN